MTGWASSTTFSVASEAPTDDNVITEMIFGGSSLIGGFGGLEDTEEGRGSPPLKGLVGVRSKVALSTHMGEISSLTHLQLRNEEL